MKAPRERKEEVRELSPSALDIGNKEENERGAGDTEGSRESEAPGPWQAKSFQEEEVVVCVRCRWEVK